MKLLREILAGTGLHPLRRFRVRAVPFVRVSLFETENSDHWKQATRNNMMYFCVDFGDSCTTATCEIIDDNEVKQVAQIRIWKRADFALNSDLLNSVRALAKAHACGAAIYDKNAQEDMFYMFDEFECEMSQLWIAFDKKPPVFGNCY